MCDIPEERIFEIEVAKNGRASCKKCKSKCLQGELRIAKIVANPFADGKMKNWHHVNCIFDMLKKQRATTKRIESEDDIIGFDLISDDNQKLIKNKIEELIQQFGPSNKSLTKRSNETKDNIANASSKLSPKDSNSSLDNLFQTFQEIVRKVADHPSYIDKTNIIKKFFENGKNGNAFNGDIEIWCRLLLPGSIKRIYNLQSKQLVKLFSKIFVEDQEEMLQHLAQGDVSETVSHFFKQSQIYKPVTANSIITIQEVDSFLEKLSKLTKDQEQMTHFTKILKMLTANDLKTIIRLIKHDLKMGAGAKHILEGVHPDAYNVYKACKDLDSVVERCFGNRKAQHAEIKILTPVFPMLAEACKSIEYAQKKCPNGMFSEIKYDGERVQVHKHGQDFKYFSRSLKPVMPHKVAHFKEYIGKAFPHGNDLILDTEILMIDTGTGKPLPFGTLGVHKKAQFRDASVCLFVFDCIYYNGENLMNKPLRERKRILNENMKEIPNHIVFSEMQEIQDTKQLAQMIAKVLKLGLEGLVLKDTMSNYEPGKRHWLKVKKDYLFGGAIADSADLIVLGAWYGTGQKGGLMSVFLMGCYNKKTKKFCTVTKVHTGHDDQTLERLQKELKMIKIYGDPEKVPDWLQCTRTMVPDFVAENPKAQPIWEITGAEFTQQHDVHTANGISIRFPRVTKIRNDKNWKTATSVDELENLFMNSKKDVDVSLLLKQYEGQLNDNDHNHSKKASLSEKKRKITDYIRDSANEAKKPKLNQEIIKVAQQQSPKKNTTNRKRVNIENELPIIFKPIISYFESTTHPEIERYFKAYGGTILSLEHCKKATHIFHSIEKVQNIENKWPQNCKHVHVSWIVDSVNKSKLEPFERYKVAWKPVNGEEEKRYKKIFQSEESANT